MEEKFLQNLITLQCSFMTRRANPIGLWLMGWCTKRCTVIRGAKQSSSSCPNYVEFFKYMVPSATHLQIPSQHNSCLSMIDVSVHTQRFCSGSLDHQHPCIDISTNLVHGWLVRLYMDTFGPFHSGENMWNDLLSLVLGPFTFEDNSRDYSWRRGCSVRGYFRCVVVQGKEYVVGDISLADCDSGLRILHTEDHSSVAERNCALFALHSLVEREKHIYTCAIWKWV